MIAIGPHINMNNWQHKNEWHQRGKDFLVVVKHHTINSIIPDHGDGQNRWTVYAYIYPTHQSFSNFSGSWCSQPAASVLPLHGGPSILRYHYNDFGAVTSVMVGADYNHLHDSEFTFYDDPDDAQEVFDDAQALYVHLSKHIE